MVKIGVVHLETCSPSSLDEVGVFSEGFWMTLHEESHKGHPLFLPLVGCSSGVMSKPAIFPSCGLGIIASWSDKQCQHLVLVEGDSILDPVCGEAVDGSSLPTTGCGVVASMVASGTLPVRSCKGYISTPWALRGQTCKAVPQASTNAWQMHPSSAITSHSNLSILSSWDCSKVWAWVAQWASTSLTVTS